MVGRHRGRRLDFALVVLGLLLVACTPNTLTGSQPETTEAPPQTVVPETPTSLPSPTVPTSVAVPSDTPPAAETAADDEIPVLDFDGNRALEHVAAQMALGPRPTGSSASQATAEYILTTLRELGWETEVQPFEYQGVDAQNLVARAGNTDGPVLMFGAHYDTRRRADQDPEQPDMPVPGANDGASGVAVLLELARSIDLERVNGEVWLVFFDAEDNGHLDGWEYIAGSREFVAQMTVRPLYFVLVDMIGDADQQLYLERNSDPELSLYLWQIAHELGYAESFIMVENHAMLDDHTPFSEAGIPAVDIIDFDYPYWHTVEDTLDKISATSLERVGRVLEFFLERGDAVNSASGG